MGRQVSTLLIKSQPRMNQSSKREVASAILLDDSGRLLMQQRDMIAGIDHPGKIGLFGGHRKAHETYLQCVVREIYEEIHYFIPPGDFDYLTSYEAIDHELGGCLVHAEFFIARELQIKRLIVTEGSLLVIEPDEVSAIGGKLTPDARFGLQAFLDENRGGLPNLP